MQWAGANASKHHDAVAHVQQWFNEHNFKIMKLRLNIIAGDDGPELAFERIPLIRHDHAGAYAHHG